VVFWDFDGVIKDSVGAKTRAFETLFLPFGSEVSARVRAHHEANGGVSRFQKIPIYLNWAGLAANDKQVQAFCDKFSTLVLQEVINAPWVPGVFDYLQQNCANQYFILITATPQEEIEYILHNTGIIHCFREVHGAPNPKSDVVASALRRLKVEPANALVIGDAETDLMAARVNSIPFLLRRTAINQHIQRCYDGPQFDNLKL
jgi:phosphoglycolate phosphatase-like HAD superfamily hydrolase